MSLCSPEVLRIMYEKNRDKNSVGTMYAVLSYVCKSPSETIAEGKRLLGMYITWNEQKKFANLYAC